MQNTQHEELRSFEAFLTYCFTKGMGLPVPAPLQLDVARWLEKPVLAADGKYRLQVQAMRGLGKSVISAAYALHILYWNPDAKILVVSGTNDLATTFVELCRKMMATAPLLHHMAPRKAMQGSPTGKDQVDARNELDCGHLVAPSRDVSLKAASIGGNLTGLHPDYIIADDIELEKNSDTVGKREKLVKSVAEFEAMIKKGGTLVFLGTPHSSDDSIYYRLEKAAPIRRWPAEYPDPDDLTAAANVSPWLIGKVQKDIELIGHATCPELADDAALEIKRVTAGFEGWYELQYLLNPALLDEQRYPLRARDLIIMSCEPKQAPALIHWSTAETWDKISFDGIGDDALHKPGYVSDDRVPYDQMLMSIDPSGSGQDETAYCIAAVANGKFFILETGGYKGGSSPDVLAMLAKKAAKWGIKQVLIESNFGDGLFTRVLHPYIAEINGPTEVKEIRVAGQKESRIIETIRPLVFNHQVVFDRSVAKDKDVMHQYTHITSARGSLKHDDRIDAIALALGALAHWAGVDPEKNVEKAKAKARKAEQDAWMNDPRKILEGMSWMSDSVEHTSTSRKGLTRNQRPNSGWGWGGNRR